MPDFIDKLALRVEAKRDRLGHTFSFSASGAEAELREIVRANWHTLPPETFRSRRRPAIAVDASIGRADLSNGSTLFAAQALCIGHGPTLDDTIECSRVEVEILPGSIDEGSLKRYHDLVMQSLEVSVAREASARLPDGGVIYMDGVIYSRLPQLYQLEIEGVEPLNQLIAADYLALFDGCRRSRRCVDLIAIAKTSKSDLHIRQWAGHSDAIHTVAISDSEAIYRWTDGLAGFSSPVLLGHVSFSGGNDYVLEDTGLADAPAIVAFFARLADYDDALLIECPATCLGHSGTLRSLDAELLDLTRFDITPILQTIASDYGGLEVYNALLYSVDREVRLHRTTMQEVYMPLVADMVGAELRLDRSDRRF